MNDIRDSNYTIYSLNVHQRRLRRETGKEIQEYSNLPACLKKLYNNERVICFVNPQQINFYNVNESEEIHISRSNPLLYDAYHASPDWPLLPKFNWLIQQMFDSGITEKYLKTVRMIVRHRKIKNTEKEKREYEFCYFDRERDLSGFKLFLSAETTLTPLNPKALLDTELVLIENDIFFNLIKTAIQNIKATYNLKVYPFVPTFDDNNNPQGSNEHWKMQSNFVNDNVGYLVSRKNVTSRIKILFKSVNKGSWLCAFVIFVMYVIALRNIFKLSWTNAFFDIIRLFTHSLQSRVFKKARYASELILMVALFIHTSFIGTYFWTSLSALSTISNARSNLETMSDLQDSDYTIYAPKVHLRRLQRQTGKNIFEYMNITSCLKMLHNRERVICFANSRQFKRFKVNETEEIHISEPFPLPFDGYHASPDWPLLPRFNWILRQMLDTGITTNYLKGVRTIIRLKDLIKHTGKGSEVKLAAVAWFCSYLQEYESCYFDQSRDLSGYQLFLSTETGLTPLDSKNVSDTDRALIIKETHFPLILMIIQNLKAKYYLKVYPFIPPFDENTNPQGSCIDIISEKIDISARPTVIDEHWKMQSTFVKNNVGYIVSRKNITSRLKILFGSSNTESCMDAFVIFVIYVIILRNIFKLSWTYSFFEIIHLFTHSLQSRIFKKARYTSERILIVVLIVLASFIGTYFWTSLSALSTITNAYSNFETISDLKNSDYKIYSLKTQQRRLQRETGKEIRVFINLSSCLDMLNNNERVICFVTPIELNRYDVKETEEIHVSKSISLLFDAYHASPDWPLLPKFNWIIHQMFETGLTDYYLNRVRKLINRYDLHKKAEKGSEVKLAWVVLLGSCGVAALIFLFEFWK
ncbi:hypothetical protein TKK_0009328 [Trichogramma kaykai]